MFETTTAAQVLEGQFIVEGRTWLAVLAAVQLPGHAIFATSHGVRRYPLRSTVSVATARVPR